MRIYETSGIGTAAISLDRRNEKESDQRGFLAYPAAIFRRDGEEYT
jgi:hypothetical protein